MTGLDHIDYIKLIVNLLSVIKKECASFIIHISNVITIRITKLKKTKIGLFFPLVADL